MDDKLVCLRKVARYKLGSCLLEGGQKGDVAGQAIKLRNKQSRIGQSTELQSLCELRSVVVLAALYVGVFSRQEAARLALKRLYRNLLGLQSEPGTPLPVGRNSVIGNKSRFCLSWNDTLRGE
jgi:hypothetical protein